VKHLVAASPNYPYLFAPQAQTLVFYSVKSDYSVIQQVVSSPQLTDVTFKCLSFSISDGLPTEATASPPFPSYPFYLHPSYKDDQDS